MSTKKAEKTKKRIKQGKLTVIGGPMFSGKTTKLLTIYNILKKLGKVVLCFKADPDINGGIGHTDSHDKRSLPVIFISPNQPESILRFVSKKDVQVVIIDEVNFFPKAKMKKVIKKLLSWGISVYANGLIRDYRKKEFGATQELMKIANEKIKLFAVCDKCGDRAAHTERVGGGTAQIISDRNAKYIASCTRCHLVYKKTKKK